MSWPIKTLVVATSLSLYTLADSSPHNQPILIGGNADGFDVDDPLVSGSDDGRRTRLVTHRQRRQLVPQHREEHVGGDLEQLPEDDSTNHDEIESSMVGRTRRVEKQKEKKLERKHKQKATEEDQGANEKDGAGSPPELTKKEKKVDTNKMHVKNKVKDNEKADDSSNGSLAGLFLKEKNMDAEKLPDRKKEKNDEQSKHQKKDSEHPKKALLNEKDDKDGATVTTVNKKDQKELMKKQKADMTKERKNDDKAEGKVKEKQKAMVKKEKIDPVMKKEKKKAHINGGETVDKEEMLRKEEKRLKKKENVLNKVAPRPDQKPNAVSNRADPWNGHGHWSDECICIEKWIDDGWDNDGWSSHHDHSGWMAGEADSGGRKKKEKDLNRELVGKAPKTGKHFKNGKSKSWSTESWPSESWSTDTWSSESWSADSWPSESWSSDSWESWSADSWPKPWPRPPPTKECKRWKCLKHPPWTPSPTISPTLSPTLFPTLFPTLSPTLFPTFFPTMNPTWSKDGWPGDGWPKKPPKGWSGDEWSKKPPKWPGDGWPKEPPKGWSGDEWSKKPPKGWSGDEWSKKPPKGWSGDEWSKKPPKGWSGDEWSKKPPKGWPGDGWSGDERPKHPEESTSWSGDSHSSSGDRSEEPTKKPTPGPTTACQGRKWYHSTTLKGCTNALVGSSGTLYDSARECCLMVFGFAQCDRYDMCGPTSSPSNRPIGTSSSVSWSGDSHNSMWSGDEWHKKPPKGWSGDEWSKEPPKGWSGDEWSKKPPKGWSGDEWKEPPKGWSGDEWPTKPPKGWSGDEWSSGGAKPTKSPTPPPTTCEGRKWHYSADINGCANTQFIKAADDKLYNSARECCMKEFGFYPCETYDMCAPTSSPSTDPTIAPTLFPTLSPTTSPTLLPTLYPTLYPTLAPSQHPTLSPTGGHPTKWSGDSHNPWSGDSWKLTPPTKWSGDSHPWSGKTWKSQPSTTKWSGDSHPSWSGNPWKKPSTLEPTTEWPTFSPSKSPTNKPTASPSSKPTSAPTTSKPSKSPSNSPTQSPTAVQCIYDPQDGGYTDFPVCPGNTQYCNGDRDCGTELCNCDAGDSICQGDNPCQAQCVLDDSDGIYKPICPGSNTFCDGDRDCTNASGRCSCIAGRRFCSTGVNTCHPDPTQSPSLSPTTGTPTTMPTFFPTESPSLFPTHSPSDEPTHSPTLFPTLYPTFDPTSDPTLFPTLHPTTSPTLVPSFHPTTPSPMVAQCVYDPQDEAFWPVCTGNSHDEFCDGDPRNCGTYLCDCSAGESICRGNNPCEVECKLDDSDGIYKPVCPGSTTYCNGEASDCDNPRLDRCICDAGDMMCSGINVCNQPTTSPTSNPTKAPTTSPTQSPTLNPTTASPIGTQCVFDPIANSYWPVCPGNTEDEFCDGDSRNCGTYLCDCDAGRKICRGANPCEIDCELDDSDGIYKPVCPGSNTFCNGGSDCDNPRLERCLCDAGERLCDGDNVCSQPTVSPTVNPTERPTKSPTQSPTLNPTTSSPISTQCVFDPIANSYWPVCPGNTEDEFCDGDPRNCGTFLCDCEAGKSTCRKRNPCETECRLDDSDDIYKPVCPGSNTYCNGGSDCDIPRLERCLCDAGERICDGDNVCSQPTVSPTLSPTERPTTSPTQSPTLHPTTSSPIGTQCVYDTQDETYWPVCPGNNEDEFCDGDPRNCGTYLCDCDKGKTICRGTNPCEVECKLDDDGIYKPKCPGSDSYCNGGSDCDNPRLDRCLCDAGERICDGDNVCSQPTASPTMIPTEIPTNSPTQFPSYNPTTSSPIGARCVFDPVGDSYWPVCPGNTDDEFCDGVTRNCGTFLCNCDDGRKICRGNNPCEIRCEPDELDDGIYKPICPGSNTFCNGGNDCDVPRLERCLCDAGDLICSGTNVCTQPTPSPTKKPI